MRKPLNSFRLLFFGVDDCPNSLLVTFFRDVGSIKIK